MARLLRIELAGGLYHVTARGDGREAIYFGDHDRRVWLEVLAAVCMRFNWRCHAWCQMTNHYHLLIETPDANLSRGMRHLNGVYTQYINRSHARVGHLFPGALYRRYTGILVEANSYLLEVARYVVLNPVRAGMVAYPGEWPWSSYAAMIGEAPCPAWLERDWLLGQFAKRRATAIRRYIDFVRAGVGRAPLWQELEGQVFLGGEAFVERMKRHLPDTDLREVPRAQRRRAPPPLSSFTAMADRQAGIVAAYRGGGYSMKEIGDAFGVHYATVSRAVKRAEALDCKTCDPGHREEAVAEMLSDWPFLANVVNDTEMVLAKVDLGIGSWYAELAPENSRPVFDVIQAEYDRTVDLILRLKGNRQLLDDEPALKRSIGLRNPYMDPMSLVQVDLLTRWRAAGREDDALFRSLLSTVNGIAHGLQQSG